jgi:flagellar hook assembly protein FlgD
MSLATVAAQQNSASTTAAPQTGSAALNSLSANFGDFLKLLMTQLQNQNPTSPLDTNQFTSELVQFSSVEQQINTNTSLTPQESPHLSDRSKNVGEERLVLQHLGEAMHQRAQPVITHGGQ